MAFLDKIKRHSVVIAGMAVMLFVLLIGLMIVTEGVGYHGLFSPHKIHQEQTNALLRGEFAVSHDITTLQADNVWHAGGVQQVWGLGVPFLRLPFYALAHLFGYEAFPDLIIFLFWVGVALYSLGFVSYLWLKKRGVKEAGVIGAFIMSIAAFFPPILLIMKSRFIVYEEVITYGYFYVLCIFALVLALTIKHRSKGLFLSIAVFAGLAGFVRPTLFAYTLPMFLYAFTVSRKHLSLSVRLLGVLLFVGGIGLLALTNEIRFGSPTEFGHHVNVAGDLNSVNLTRFESEYTTETPLYRKFAETYGALFLFDSLPQVNGLYHPDILHFQAPEIRWRHMSFPAIHWYYFAAFIMLALVGRKSGLTVIPLVSFALLFGFYSFSFMISSRYLIDFAAAYSIAFIISALMIVSKNKSYATSLLCIAIVGLFIFGFKANVDAVSRPVKSSSQTVQSSPVRFSKYVPDMYQVGRLPGLSTYNGAGWNYANGKMKSAASFVVTNPQFIKVSLECVTGTCNSLEETLQARLDGEFLKLISIVREGKNVEVLFKVPEELIEQGGEQVVFLRTVRIGKTIPEPEFIMKKLEWN
jgi:hypothetical protein